MQNWRMGQLAIRESQRLQREGQLLLHLFHKLRDSPFIDQVFQSSFLTIGAVAVLSKDSDDSCGDGDTFFWFNYDTGICRKLGMAGYPGQLDTEIDVWRHRFPFRNPDRNKPDIVSVSHDADSAATVEPDVELPRDVIHVPVVQNVIVKGRGVRL